MNFPPELLDELGRIYARVALDRLLKDMEDLAKRQAAGEQATEQEDKQSGDADEHKR
jgi:hypothetical protein